MAAHFVGEMIERDVLRFGDFTLKSGRKSPYFFNLGSIDDGAGLAHARQRLRARDHVVGTRGSGRDLRASI